MKEKGLSEINVLKRKINIKVRKNDWTGGWRFSIVLIRDTNNAEVTSVKDPLSITSEIPPRADQFFLNVPVYQNNLNYLMPIECYLIAHLIPANIKSGFIHSPIFFFPETLSTWNFLLLTGNTMKKHLSTFMGV